MSGDEPKRLNERASRNGIKSLKLLQVIDFACDPEIQKPKRGNHPERYYSQEEAIKLVSTASKLGNKLTLDEAIEQIETAISWFDNESDSNPFRMALVLAEHDLAQLREDEARIEADTESLRNQRDELNTQRDMTDAVIRRNKSARSVHQ